ncbi:MAG: hypothetical protein R2822_24535 [Spirosomataceae bacterium]
MFKKIIFVFLGNLAALGAFSQSNGMSNVTRDMMNIDGMKVSNIQNVAFLVLKALKEML